MRFLTIAAKALLVVAGCVAGATSALAQALPDRKPFYIAPTLEGIFLCEEAAGNPAIKGIDEAYAYCTSRKLDGASAVAKYLDTLEPGGARGRVQVGYTATLQLLGLYQRKGRDWVIDKAKVDAFINVISKVDRPVVVYLSADHFDSQGPLPEELLKDPQNLMHLKDGTAPVSGYFGYKIIPYTLLADEDIPVNTYRFSALRHVAGRLNALPKPVRERIVGITLAGELHQMFPDFENGMGAFKSVSVTDYSDKSVSRFRQWLKVKYDTIQKFNAATGFSYASFEALPVPAKDIRKEGLSSFGEHYDAFADGTLPLFGWLWDPEQRIAEVQLYVDGKPAGQVTRGLNRLDVYRAEAAIDSPSTGYRVDLDFSALAPGRHSAQLAAVSKGESYLLAQVEFNIVPRDQGKVANLPFKLVPLSRNAKDLPGVRGWMDHPKPLQDVYYNPLAREWNLYRAAQVRQFLEAFHRVAKEAGLPVDKLYSHQIIPAVNSSWNAQLFAVDATLTAGTPWLAGLNMYGGAADSEWVKAFMAGRNMADYGIPEFNPQQWKKSGVHQAALRAHYVNGARFVSPYYISIIPDRFKSGVGHGVNSMEIRPDNKKDGSDLFYGAIREFAKH